MSHGMELEVALSCPTIGYRVNRGSLALLPVGARGKRHGWGGKRYGLACGLGMMGFGERLGHGTW